MRKAIAIISIGFALALSAAGAATSFAHHPAHAVAGCDMKYRGGAC